MNFNEFKNEMEKIYYKRFPDSRIIMDFDDAWLLSCITIRCYLSKSCEECPLNISDRDIFNLSFLIWLPANHSLEDDFPMDTIMEACDNLFIKCKPNETFCKYTLKGIPYRTVESPDGILKEFENFTENLYNTNEAEYMKAKKEKFKEIAKVNKKRK